MLFDIDCNFFAGAVCSSLHQLTNRLCDFAMLADYFSHVACGNGKLEADGGFAFFRNGNDNVLGTVNNRSRNVGESTLEIGHSAILTKLFSDAGFFEQALNGFSGLSAVGDPLGCFFRVDLDFNGVGEGVVVTDLFDETAVTGVTGVSNNYAVKGSFLSTDSFKSDFNGHLIFLQIK